MTQDEDPQDDSRVSVHWSFRAIAVVALIWNVMGGINFFMQMDGQVLAQMPESHQAIVAGRPLWATAGFAVGVSGGALGALLLLLRLGLATRVFMASLGGVVLTMIHTALIAASGVAFSPMDVVLMIVSPLAVAAFLIWYARWAEARSWIG